MTTRQPAAVTPEEVRFTMVRDELIPLPSEDEGYRRVRILGTTGAGKTTLVRQLIGTDPVSERFPSTSNSRCTVHDTEIVLDDGPWRLAVTFASESKVRLHLEECISAAVIAAYNGADDREVRQHLLDHVDQRFRFYYVLGNGPRPEGTGFGFRNRQAGENPTLLSADEFGQIDMAYTDELLVQITTRLRGLTSRLVNELGENLGAVGDEDESALNELFEDSLDSQLLSDNEFSEISDELMDEMKKRFGLLPSEGLRTTPDGWPMAWSGEWSPDQRGDFLRAVLRFSSNHSSLWGSVLTPLVNGVRVAGQFAPDWYGDGTPKLILVDGEGLGHTPDSASSVPPSVSAAIEKADAVILVDDARVPMQAAPAAAMYEIAESGNAYKLILAFTHFDEVRGDDLPTEEDKAEKVWASVAQQLDSFGKNQGLHVERPLRLRLVEARFFLSNLQNAISGDSIDAEQLCGLIKAIESVEKPDLPEARPVYVLDDLANVIPNASISFHRLWRARLGLDGARATEHWTRIKAMSRRLSQFDEDGYDTLQPVADIRRELRTQINAFIDRPSRWEVPSTSEQEKQHIYDELKNNISNRLVALSTSRMREDRFDEWWDAYELRGRGSTRVRAAIIGDDIYREAAPTDLLNRDELIQEVLAIVRAAADEIGARLIDIE